MDKINNLSIRKTIVLYMVISLTIGFFISAATMRCSIVIQNKIWWKYVDKDKYFEMEDGEGVRYIVDAPRPDADEMKRFDYYISEICDFLQTFTVLIISVLSSIVAVFLFYKNKLKHPIEELELASRKIGQDNLEFQITYKNQDEMGILCQEFEQMRQQLAENNKKLWKIIEEERALRAAIAHDIRSPLTVLKGYEEMLREYLPSENADMDKAVKMLEESEKQIQRMNTFVETMQKMSSLDKRELVLEEITGEELKKDIQAEIDILEKQFEKSCILFVEETQDSFYGDREVILEVTENLLSNALRYAKQQIKIELSVAKEKVRICVKDDGIGFGKNIEEITKPFYQQNIKDSLKHAGLGMYISRLYCEKHGGRLLLENGENTGAVITAVFRRIA